MLSPGNIAETGDRERDGGRWRIRTSDFLLVRQALWASELTARYWRFYQSNPLRFK